MHMVKYLFILISTIFAYPSIAQNNLKSEINALLLKGDSLTYLNEDIDTKSIYENTLLKSNKINYKYGIAKSYLGLSNQAKKNISPKQAIEYLFLAENNTNKDPQILSEVNFSKGNFLKIGRSFDEAINRYLLALDFFDQIESKSKHIFLKQQIQINLSSIYIGLEKNELAKKLLYQTINSNNLSIKLQSAIYLAEIYIAENKLDSAKKYIDLVDDSIHNISNNFNKINSNFKGVVGLYNLQIEDYNNAISALKSNAASPILHDKNELLALSFLGLKNNDSALFYYELYKKNKIEDKSLKMEEAIYTSIIHKDENNFIQERNRKIRSYYTLIIILSSLLIIILCFIFYYRQKTSKQRAKILLEEQEKLLLENEIFNIKQEQYRKQVLASSVQLDYKRKVLLELKNKIANGDNFNIVKFLSNKHFIDKDLNNIAEIVKEVHPQFFINLKKMSDNKLSNLDLQYAAFVYMNLNNHQIADILNVSLNNVNVNKFRLKQKLNLEKEVDLEEFIRKLSF